MIAVALPANAREKSFFESVLGIFSADPSLEDIPGLRKLAKRGNEEAQFLLYVAYRTMPRGNISPQESSNRLISLKEAGDGLRTAAKQDYSKAVAQLGIALHLGQSLRQDSSAAVPWLEKAYDTVSADQRPPVAYFLGDALLAKAGSTPEETERGLKLLDEALAGGAIIAVRPRAKAMSNSGDEAGARAYLEAAVENKNKTAITPLASMLIDGKGGPADVARGLDLLQSAHKLEGKLGGLELAGEHLSGGHLMRNPLKAMMLMARHAEDYTETRQKLAQMLLTYPLSQSNFAILFLRMKEDELLGEPDAAWNLLRLLDRRRQYFRDDGYIFDLVDRHKRTDVRIELHGAKINARFAIHSAQPELFTKMARKTIDKLIAQNMAAAFTLKGELQRQGVVYPQDDIAASQNLLKGAELGDLEAMIKLADAYDNGTGLARNDAENVKWLRMAAARGSHKAKRALMWDFTRNPIITLREGLTEAIVVYGDDIGSIYTSQQVGGIFISLHFRKFTKAEVTSAFMDGFRAAPAAAQGKKLVYLQRRVPQKIWAGVEAVLMAEGHFKGPPDGYFGPDARAGLLKWAVAKGRLPAPGEE